MAHLPVPAEAAEPGFLLVNNVLTITFGPDTWVIDAPLFGPSARVLHDRVGQAHRVRLQEARFQGTRIEANFEAHIQPRGPDWYIAVKFSNQPPQEFLLSRWMHGDAAVHWHITDPISLTTVTWLEIPSGGAEFTLDKTLALRRRLPPMVSTGFSSTPSLLKVTCIARCTDGMPTSKSSLKGFTYLMATASRPSK